MDLVRLRVPLSAIVFFSLIVQSCSLVTPPSNIPPGPSLPPAWTPTFSPLPPTAQSAATRAPAPSPKPACDLSTTLSTVKASIPYDQYSVHFVDLAGTASLVVWYVDPDLEPFPSSPQLQIQLEEAKLRAAELSATVNAASPCSPKLFDVINPIVVDRHYQGWLSAQILPADLPRQERFTPEDLSLASHLFQVSYLRTALSHPDVKGTCDWPEASHRLQSHFAPDRELVAFYFVIDDLGSHVWVQWDGDANPIMAVASLGNVSLALECFSPTADVIYIIVNTDGAALDMGVLPARQPE